MCSKRDVLSRPISNCLVNLSDICPPVLVTSIRRKIHHLNSSLYQFINEVKSKKFKHLVYNLNEQFKVYNNINVVDIHNAHEINVSNVINNSNVHEVNDNVYDNVHDLEVNNELVVNNVDEYNPTARDVNPVVTQNTTLSVNLRSPVKAMQLVKMSGYHGVEMLKYRNVEISTC